VAKLEAVVRDISRARFESSEPRVPIMGHFIGQEFKGDKPTQLRFLGLVNHTHAVSSQLLENTVVRDGLTDHGGGRVQMARPHVRGA
jgi:hypothetical protein